jgi:hypothetical protein
MSSWLQDAVVKGVAAVGEGRVGMCCSSNVEGAGGQQPRHSGVLAACNALCRSYVLLCHQCGMYSIGRLATGKAALEQQSLSQ